MSAREPVWVELASRRYPIRFVDELPDRTVAEECARVVGDGATSQALLVTDSNVGPLYARGVRAALEARSFRVIVYEVAAGEGAKSLDNVGRIIDVALGAQQSRRDLVVALGGGVVGDLAGFVAAILLRGIAFVQVPTTLLAQVDSAVGGKTGVNHPAGKNLVGAFWQPRSVVVSQTVLGTLAERDLRAGLAECIKIGMVASADLVDWIARRLDAYGGPIELLLRQPADALELVARCCRLKAEVVAEDELDTGRRAILNYGHTLGHAYEQVVGYGRLRHGEAVALGMVWAARLAEALSVAPPGSLIEPTIALLAAAGLPHQPEEQDLPPLEELVAATRSDKKAHRDRVDFVLLERIGQPLIQTLDSGHTLQALKGPQSSSKARSEDDA